MCRIILLMLWLFGLNIAKSHHFQNITQSAVTVNPNFQNAKEYEDVVIECRVRHGKALWRRPQNLPLPTGASVKKGRLLIKSIKPSDSGFYICSDESETNKAAAFVKVLRAITTTTEYFTNRTITSAAVTSGLLATSVFSTSVGELLSTPYPCMYGTCNGTCCGENFAENYFDCSNGQKINRSLVCNRENDCDDGSDESRCSHWPPKITVLPKPEVEVYCGDQGGEKSGTLILECQSVGHPSPLIRWKKYDGHVPSKCQQYSKRGHGILTCPNFQQSDQGAYSCLAENIVKSAESQPKSVARCSNTINCRGFRIVNEERIEHCLECYCSGKTSQCHSIKSNSAVKEFAFPDSKTEIFAAENGEILFIPTKTDLTPSPQIRQSAQEIAYCILTEQDFGETSFLKSFGRSIIIPRYRGAVDFMIRAPDLIIRGNGLSLMYTVNLISSKSMSHIPARFWPGNWHLPNKIAASREVLMKVLSNVDALFVRCEYEQGKPVAWDKNATISLESSVITDLATSVSYVEKCICPTGYDGLSCEYCAIGYKKKLQGNDFICEKIYVPPVCKEGYIGPHCNNCDAVKGYIKRGENCIKPECHPGGSVSFPPKSGTCSCKVGVTGDFCDECASGYFYLNKAGCQKCWCSGVTNQCKSSALHKTVISNTARGGYNSSDGRNFWLLPSDFRGNRLTSYGGYLNYTMKYKPGIAKQNSYLTVEFLSEDDVTFIYTHFEVDRSILKNDKSWSVPINEYSWKKSDKSSITRGEFLTVLSKIKAVYIESPYHLTSGQVNLTSARMTTASSSDFGTELAVAVEQCSCPVGYTGLSCESCSNGYYKKRNGTITQCIKCNCTNCDPEFGCPTCPELTYRDNPEDEKMPICKPCPCNKRGVSCVKDDHGQIFCICKSGFSGMHCENILPKETDELTVSISPRKIKGMKVGTRVFVNCSYSTNEELVLTTKKTYSSLRQSLPSDNFNYSGTVIREKSKVTQTFEVVLEDELKSFECFVHDAQGKLAGTVIARVEDMITVIKPVKIKNCYSDRIDVKESETREIICEATGSPTPVVNWYRLKHGTASEKVDSSDGVHTIESASLTDNGTIFTCIAENSEGDKATCTQVLIVRKKCEVVNIIPREVKAEEKQNISIQCKTTAKSPVYWTQYDFFSGKEKSIVPFRIKQNNGYLHIIDSQVSDSGTYICSANGENGKINKTVLVVVEKKKIPPAVTIQEYDKILKVGESCNATCLGTGNPTPSISWTKLNGTLGSNVNVKDGTLTISGAKPENSGIYQCEGISSLGKATADISIEVEDIKHAPVVNISEEKIKVHDGDEVNLTCLTIGYPRPKISWFASNITFSTISRLNDSMILIVPQQSFKEEISFKVTKEMDGKTISCIAENTAGKSSKSVIIKVLQSQGGVNETVEFVPIGSYFELICDLTGDLKWEKTNRFVGDECPIPNGLMILSVQSQHNGTYICKENGDPKKIINLIVVGFVPKFSSTFKSYLVLPAMLKSSHELRIEMTFHSRSEKGLLLRKDNNKFSIYLEESKIHLSVYSKDGDFLDIKLNKLIPLNVWFTLVVIIYGNYVDITVYNENTDIYERKTEGPKGFNISMGRGSESFFVGGHPNQRHLTGLFFRRISHFDGCISRLIIDRHEYDIVKESSFSQNVTLCRKCSEEPNLCHENGKCLDAPTQYGFICVCPNDQNNKVEVTCPQSCAGKGCETQLDLCGLLKPCNGAFLNKCTNNMYTLECTCAHGFSGTTCEQALDYSFCANGNGFLRLPSNLLERRLGFPETIRMAFTLQKPNGQLLWQGDKFNYLSIAVDDRKLKYSYINQHSELLVLGKRKLEMNEKHTLSVKRINGSVTVEVTGVNQSGDVSEIYKNSTTKFHTNRVTGDIYLGNVPNYTLPAGHYEGLNGCIHYVSFGNKPKINLPEKELEKFNAYQTKKLYSRASYESYESESSNDVDSDYQ